MSRQSILEHLGTDIDLNGIDEYDCQLDSKLFIQIITYYLILKLITVGVIRLGIFLVIMMIISGLKS